MATITITKRLESETLVLPELREFIGKTVEIRVTDTSAPAGEDLIDHEYHALLEAEEAADPEPVPTLEEVRAILSKIPGNMSDDIRAERDERG